MHYVLCAISEVKVCLLILSSHQKGEKSYCGEWAKNRLINLLDIFIIIYYVVCIFVFFRDFIH